MKSKHKVLPIVLIIAMVTAILAFTVLALTTTLPEPQLEIVGTNLSFSDSVYIKYAVSFDEIESEDDIKLLIWRTPQTDYTAGTEAAAISASGTSEVSGRQCAIFNYTQLAAKEMTDVVYARAVYTKDDQTYYSDVKKYSVLTYVYNKLGYTGTATQNEDLAALLGGLIEYGASAQKYFNYKTDALATDKHVKVTVENGHFEDGCSTALVVPGTTLKVTAPLTNENGGFVYWQDGEGNILSTDRTYEITAGDVNSSLLAVYISYNGGSVEGAGATLADDSFAMTSHTVNTDVVTDISSSQLTTLIQNGLEAGEVYRVNDGNPVTLSSGFDGNGAAIIVPAGITFDSLNDTTVSNAIILSSVTVSNSSNVIFSQIDVQSESDSVSVSSGCSDITFDGCRIVAVDTGIESYAVNTTIKNAYVKGSNGIVLNSSESTVYNSNVIGNDVAISTVGSDNAVNNNTVLASPIGNGIRVDSGSLNSLLSYNVIAGSKASIAVNGATNTVVLFNSVYDVEAVNNVNLYIVENSIGGALDLNGNNYLLCDANTYDDNGRDHTLISVNNENTNGDTLMDVTARNEVGAKEELLPHTNKDLFIGMERKSTVKDVANGTSYDLTAFIEENAKSNGIVIVPPGAYTTAKGDYILLTEDMSNTDIYAFGVYNDHEFKTNQEYLDDPNRVPNYVIQISGSKNVSIHGMTNAYNYQSLGQAHVLEKLDNYQIRVVPSAGFDLELGWGLSNPGVFRASFYACHKGKPTPWFETSYTFVQANDDKTIIIKLSETDYNRLGVGDILCTRMAGDNQTSISVVNAENILFKDCVLHGYAAALAHVITGRSYNVKLERVHNCPTSPYVMSEEDYEYFTALEEQYPGVDFEMYVDSEGRYRGTQPRFCSVDATHVISGQGLDIESCLFEQMCDDGSNQHGTSKRLYGITDNGDGTATVYVKGNVTQVYHGIYTNSDNHNRTMDPLYFAAGDNIFIYTPDGEIVCDAICLTNSKNESQLNELYYLGEITYTIKVNSVKVPIESVNFAALEGYDLKDNHYRMDNKITVDNISLVSGNFTIDNYMIRNSWSRGVLTKTVNATIKNSTFQHIKSTGILGNCEPEWGESTIPRHISVENCVFDDTGFAGETWDDPKIAPVYISGLSTYGEANIHKIISTDFTVKGCHFLNYGHQYGICIDGAQNIKIIDNIFEPKASSAPGNFVKITTAVNVEISGNKYRDENGSLTTISGIDAEDYADIHGTDVDGLFPHDFDIYVAGTHLSNFKIVPEDKTNLMVGNILASKLKTICGYSVASTVMPYEKEVKLVANDNESNLIKSTSYTVECVDGQLVITAETNSALIYAVEDFAVQLLTLKNQGQKTLSYTEGYSETFSFAITEHSATNQNVFKYTGVWNASGSAMVSGGDADYVEFDFTGHTFTLLFNGEASFKVSVDDKSAVEYTTTDEMTFTLAEGEHSVRIICTDTSKPISFVGLKTYSSAITKTANRSTYIQFIGDSMVDYDTSFAHRVGDVLGWDYSVVVGDTLPETSVTRAPDVFVLFLGTDAIKSASADTTEFTTAYTSLISDIASTYNYPNVYVMLPFSTSDVDTTRESAINQAVQNWEDSLGLLDKFLYGSKVSTVSCSDWGIELDTTESDTLPTINGDYTVTVKLAQYLLNNVGNSDYINTSFPLDEMTIYNANDPTTSTLTMGMVEDGVTFNRYSFGIGGHAWLNGGSDKATAEAAVAGRYLVLMYRASGEADLTLELRTNDYGTDLGEYGKGYISKATKTENNVPEMWEIAIVDLEQFEHYTVGLTNTKIQLRMSTESDEFDIAFAAIVDDLTEAEMAAMFELGATQYRFYEDWSKVGVDVSLNGLEIEEPFDTSFVNQEYGILGMTGYNSTPVLHVKTDEGVDFVRYNFSVQGHVFLTGTNNFIGVNGDTGRYLIFKYRATNNAYIAINALTSDYTYDSAGSYMATKAKPVANITPGVWETAVVDLSTFVNASKNSKYTTDADLDVWIRLTTAAEEIDISYCAIVDDLDEAAAFIEYKGDTSFVHYVDWTSTGETVTID